MFKGSKLALKKMLAPFVASGPLASRMAFYTSKSDPHIITSGHIITLRALSSTTAKQNSGSDVSSSISAIQSRPLSSTAKQSDVRNEVSSNKSNLDLADEIASKEAEIEMLRAMVTLTQALTHP
jgi:hypothetical protein